MRIRQIATLMLAALALASAAAAGPPPDTRLRSFVRDTRLGTTYEMVTADTGFTQMASDTTIMAAYAAQSAWDSLLAGNAGRNVATLRGVFSMASTADASPSNNFFRDRDQTVAFAATSFGYAASPVSGAYLIRPEDSDFNFGTNDWTVQCWAAGMSAGNPGLSTKQVVWSLYQTPDMIQFAFAPSGYPTLLISDDYETTIDSVLIAIDYYDGDFHLFRAQRRGSTIGLKVDDLAERTTAVSNAAGALDPDTLAVFVERAGAADFIGQIGQLIIAEDSLAINADINRYAWERYEAPDTTRVNIQAAKTDLSRGSTQLVVAMSRGSTTSWNAHAFERAVLDSETTLPLLVFTTPSTPRGSRLDSIPAGALRSDIAHLFAYKNSDVFLRRIEMSHLSPTDTTLWEVRLYPDMEDSRDLSDGYDILAAPRLHANNPVYILNEDDYRLPTTSYLTVWAKAASGSVRQVTGSALIEVKIK